MHRLPPLSAHLSGRGDEIYFTSEEQKVLDELAKQKTAEKPAVPEVQPLDEAQLKLAAKLKEYKGVWVFVEQSDGVPAEVSWELLGVGVGLAKTRNVELSAMVIGIMLKTSVRILLLMAQLKLI